MAIPRPSELWAEGSADMPYKSRACALAASQMLAGAVTQEAARLRAEGFIVPSAEALLHASAVFADIASRPGGEHWLRRVDPLLSLQVACSLALAVDGLEREWDLDALSSWWAWRESQPVIDQACGALAMVNTGVVDRAVALLVADIQRAESDYGANR